MKQRTHQSSTMMRIAIAGGGGLAYILAQEIAQSANAVLVLSRNPHPELDEICQIAIVNFDNVEELRYTLRGVDLLISTVTGTEQLTLIDAADWARVRVFVPAEFEGPLSQRPRTLDSLNPASRETLRYLQTIQQSMRHTVFSCGLFMERFAPGGLQCLNMGASTGVQAPNDYLVDIENAAAEIIQLNSQGRTAEVALTSVYDVAKFVAAAIEIGPDNWPREFCMRGDHMSVLDLVNTCSEVRGVYFNLGDLQYQEAVAQAQASIDAGDYGRYLYLERIIQTANGRYNVRRANLNDTINQHDGVDVRPVRFRRWLEQIWGPGI